MLWLGYSRVSRVGDRAETLISPDLQRRRIEEYAGARGLEVELLEPELDVSGGRVERPILGAAIARVIAGEAAGIIVAQLDRLSRMDIADALKTIREIESAGGQVIAVAENFDASTPEGNLARNMFLSLGQMQLDRYKLQFAAAKRQAIERGIWPTNRPPTGYLRDPGTRGLVVDPDVAPAVAAAFEARAAGQSMRAVAAVLGRGTSTAQKILGNRVYLGELRLRIGEEVVVNREAHEPIVDRALWEAAQLGHPRPPRGRHAPALLAGLVRCAGCKRLMGLDVRKSNRYYRCRADRSAAGRCGSPALIPAPSLDKAVVATVLAHLGGISYTAERQTREVEHLEAALGLADAELGAYQKATRVAEIGAEHFAPGMRDRSEAVDAARRRLARARLSIVPLADPLEAVEDLWPEMDVEGRRHVLRGALGVVWVRRGKGLRGRIRLVAADREPADLPRPGFGGPYPIEPVEWVDDDLPGEIALIVGRTWASARAAPLRREWMATGLVTRMLAAVIGTPPAATRCRPP